MLKSLISESLPTPSSPPTHKFAITSTIIQHLADPNASTNPSTTSENGDAVVKKEGGKAGRRGMHSATGAYWNESRDGMWSFKWEGGEATGMDVVISVLWIGI